MEPRKEWIVSLERKSGETRQETIMWSENEPSIENACCLLQDRVISENQLLPFVDRGEQEPCRRRFEAAGWTVTDITPAE